MFLYYLVVIILVTVFPALVVSAIVLESMKRAGPARTWTGIAVSGVALACAPLLDLVAWWVAALVVLGTVVIAGVLQSQRDRGSALLNWAMAALLGLAAIGVAITIAAFFV